MSFLANLPYPNVIENLDYDTIRLELENLIKTKIPEWEAIESDRFMAVLEAIAYREMLLRARINDSVLSMLILYANGSDLDNIVALYGIERSKGAKPRVDVKFELSAVLSVDVTIPKGTLFRSDGSDIAKLIALNDNEPGVTIPAGQLEASGVLELDEYVETSKAKTEYIQNPLPFVIKAKQIGDYVGGAPKESDEAFRKRAILSLDRFSTAGSEKAYQYWALTLGEGLVEEAGVSTNHKAGEVIVCIKTKNNIDIAENIKNLLNADRIRPLSDLVEVEMAVRKTIGIKATIELLDSNRENEISKKIEEARKNRFALGEDVNISYLYKILHQEGVYRVTITEMKKDGNAVTIANQLAEQNEFYEITDWVLQYKDAAW
ncbi:MAG: baseplate J/gp47 family protein [Campylobacteraceae bacterium]|jgi:phage-related baseplate assembly protein|nr:baseplate J/gp47 family protein [Campylobacteraceae bacterium]